LLCLPSDIELWNASIQGNREAFGQLFRRHYSLLYQYGSKICADSPTLEDCIQDLFIELWQKKKPAPVHSVKAYLLQALKFKLYKSFRDQKRVQHLEQVNHEPFELSHETFLIHTQEDQEKAKRIFETINHLSPRQKEVIYLRIYKGLSYEEVGEIMQINYQVVRNLLCQALKAFRNLVLPCLAIIIALHSYALLCR
jgi:RNA polymerase sigma factor (sigma-70 family)